MFGGGKGGSSVTYQAASVPEASDEEKALLQKQIDWADYTLPAAKTLQDKAMDAIDNQQVTPNPNWQTLYDQAQEKTSQNQQSMSQLQNGILPSAYAENRQKALQSDLNSTIGASINGLGNKNIINSSVTSKALDGISKNASNTLYNSYLQDLSSQSQLLNQSQQFATDPINTAALAQNASIDVPKQYFAMATGQNAPTSSLLSQMSNQRYSMASPAQTIVSQNSPGVFGSLVGGAASGWACFVAGTKINMPEGEKNIEDIKVGDVIVTKDDDGNDVEETVIWVQEPKFSADDYITIEAEDLEVTTTSTQEFKMLGGFRFPADMLGAIAITDTGLKVVTNMREADKELVYDFATTGSNTYIANGFIVKGANYGDIHSL